MPGDGDPSLRMLTDRLDIELAVDRLEKKRAGKSRDPLALECEAAEELCSFASALLAQATKADHERSRQDRLICASFRQPGSEIATRVGPPDRRPCEPCSCTKDHLPGPARRPPAPASCGRRASKAALQQRPVRKLTSVTCVSLCSCPAIGSPPAVPMSRHRFPRIKTM
jgi:hypothetical protein